MKRVSHTWRKASWRFRQLAAGEALGTDERGRA